MSYSHNQKRKLIRKLKRVFGQDKWFPEYTKHRIAILKQLQGEPIGTLEDLVNYWFGR